MKKTKWIKRGSRYGNPILYKNYKGKFTVKNVERYANELKKQMLENGHEGEIAINMLIKTQEGNVWRKVIPFQDIKNHLNLFETWVDEYMGGIAFEYSEKEHVEGFEIYITKK